MTATSKAQVDYQENDTIVEIKSHLRAIPQFRSSILRLAAYGEARPESQCYLLLIEPAISEQRIDEEWSNLEKILQQRVRKRLAIYAKKGDHTIGWPRKPNETILELLDRAERSQLDIDGRALPRADYESIILQILIHQWLKKAGPMTADWLRKTAGCSYPTVSSVLQRLAPVITRQKDRRFQLARFPRKQWAELVIKSSKSRATIHYESRSSNLRSPEEMLERVARLDRPNVAVGGVTAAKRLIPSFDLVGTPRLDICVHAPDKRSDISFIRNIDPALKETDNPGSPVSLAIHFNRANDPLFDTQEGMRYANSIDCMLDLYDANLDAQAAQLLSSLKSDSGE